MADDGSWDFIGGRGTRGYMRTEWRSQWPWRVLPGIMMDGVDEIWAVVDFAKRDILKWQKKQAREKKSEGQTSLNRWLKVMDWSNLHTLKLYFPTSQTLAKLSGVTFPSLRDLTFKHSYSYHDIIDFITNYFRPLEVLSFQVMNFCSFRLVLHAISVGHAKSLTSLAVHQAEGPWEQCEQPITFSILRYQI